jgi:hypothetical protein
VAREADYDTLQTICPSIILDPCRLMFGRRPWISVAFANSHKLVITHVMIRLLIRPSPSSEKACLVPRVSTENRGLGIHECKLLFFMDLANDSHLNPMSKASRKRD